MHLHSKYREEEGVVGVLGRGSEGCEERETERGFFRFELLSPNLVLWEGPLRNLLCSPLDPPEERILHPVGG